MEEFYIRSSNEMVSRKVVHVIQEKVIDTKKCKFILIFI
jgi:hypothetical protein